MQIYVEKKLFKKKCKKKYFEEKSALVTTVTTVATVTSVATVTTVTSVTTVTYVGRQVGSYHGSSDPTYVCRCGAWAAL